MKTILYMTLTVNGCLKQANPAHPIPKEILANFRQFAGTIGNLINGRKTYDLVRAQSAQGSFSGIEIVVVSHSAWHAEGVSVVASPQQALQHLTEKGFQMALVGGGAQLNRAFLSQGLIDEIYLNIEPIMVNKGSDLVMEGHFEPNLRLINTSQLSDNIVQMHYEVNR